MFCIVVISMFVGLFFPCRSVLCMEETKGTVLTRAIVCHDRLDRPLSVPVALLKQSETIKGLIDASTEDVSADIPIALCRRDWKGLVQPALQSIEDRKGADDIGSIIGTYIQKRTTVKGKLRRYVRALNGADYLDARSLQQEITKSFARFLEGSVVDFKYLKALQKLVPPMQDELARALNYPFVRTATIENGDHVKKLAFNPDGRQFVSGSGISGTIKIWDTETHNLWGRLDAQGSVHALAFRSDGKLLVSGSSDATIKIWDPQTYTLLATLDDTNGGHRPCIRTIVFRPDGKQFASGSGDGIIKFWDAETYRLQRTLDVANIGVGGSVWALVFRSDGKQFASGSSGGVIKLWNAETYGLQEAFINDDDRDIVWALVFSPDDKQLVSRSHTGIIKVWDLEKRRLPRKLNHTNPRLASSGAVVFSPDSRQLISGSSDGTIKVWNTETYRLCGRLDYINDDCRGAHVCTLAFKPGGARLISGSTDRKIKVWNSANGSHVSNPLLALLLYIAKRKYRQERTALMIDDPDLKQLFDQLPEHEQKHFSGLCEFS